MSQGRSTGLLDLAAPFARDELVLDGRKIDTSIAEALISAEVERTMEGASTVTLELFDPDYTLIRDSELLGRRRLDKGITVEIDGLEFTLSEVEKLERGVSLVFYDSAVAKLKRFEGPLKASRNQMTRAEFAERLCREAGVGFRSPDRHVRQPIAMSRPANARPCGEPGARSAVGAQLPAPCGERTSRCRASALTPSSAATSPARIG